MFSHLKTLGIAVAGAILVAGCASQRDVAAYLGDYPYNVDQLLADRSPAPLIEPVADLVLWRMSTNLAQAGKISFRVKEWREDTENGQLRVNVADDREFLVQRPNQIKVKPAGTAEGLRAIYNVDHLAVYDAEANNFSWIGVPDHMDDFFDFMMLEYELAMPVADFLFADPYSVFRKGLLAARYRGREMVGDYYCDRVGCQHQGVDWELWVDAGERPLPRRFDITYRNAPGEPRYRITFEEWDFSPEVSDADFIFKIPDEVTVIDMASILRPDTND